MEPSDVRQQIHQIRNALQVAGTTVDLLRRRVAAFDEGDLAALLDRLDRQLVRIDSSAGMLHDRLGSASPEKAVDPPGRIARA